MSDEKPTKLSSIDERTAKIDNAFDGLDAQPPHGAIARIDIAPLTAPDIHVSQPPPGSVFIQADTVHVHAPPAALPASAPPPLPPPPPDEVDVMALCEEAAQILARKPTPLEHRALAPPPPPPPLPQPQRNAEQLGIDILIATAPKPTLGGAALVGVPFLAGASVAEWLGRKEAREAVVETQADAQHYIAMGATRRERLERLREMVERGIELGHIDERAAQRYQAEIAAEAASIIADEQQAEIARRTAMLKERENDIALGGMREATASARTAAIVAAAGGEVGAAGGRVAAASVEGMAADRIASAVSIAADRRAMMVDREVAAADRVRDGVDRLSERMDARLARIEDGRGEVSAWQEPKEDIAGERIADAAETLVEETV